MEFVQVDVFADAPYGGNPLAVFPDASELSTAQMQAIASEMNLSETAFVRSVQDDSYDIRIFTPTQELPWAGHPTIGTAWLLRDLGRLPELPALQRSPAGVTKVDDEGGLVWFERPGETEPDVEERSPEAAGDIARALRLERHCIGEEARELGRPGSLRPAFSDAGLRQLMVPLRDPQCLERCTPRDDVLRDLASIGVYCFAAIGAGRVKARGFFPGVGIAEDPATGSAAAGLGVYLAERVGAIDFEVLQGLEVRRPSRIVVRARPGAVRVGGRCELILTGRLERLP